jgi:hypothetical protein
MDGMHDLGGKQDFGPVRYTFNAPALCAQIGFGLHACRTEADSYGA